MISIKPIFPYRSLFRDPVDWPNPNTCDPHRFLNKDGTKVVHQDSFMPFSAGKELKLSLIVLHN